VCAKLYFNIYKERGVKLDNEHWNEHVPKWVETVHDGVVAILWNQQVQTDGSIPNNKPHIIIRDSERERAWT
jgi:hypothetical protein